jgi:membrane fusion protein (multidrug efflux system)
MPLVKPFENTFMSAIAKNNTEKKSSLASRLPLFMLLLLLVSLLVYLLWPQEKAQKSSFQRVVAVKMTPVLLTNFVDSVEAVGTARANEQVEITSKYSDLVDDVYFDDGQLVKKGDTLVKLNNLAEQAKVSELAANLSESEAHLQRLSDLLTSSATSKSLVDQQIAKTKAIEAQLHSAHARLNETTIKAPFSGVLGFREISRGAYIDAGDVITSLDDLSLIKVDFFLPERLLTHIELGQEITAMNVAYQDNAFTGKITAVDNRIDASTRSIKVRAIIGNEKLQLRPGMLLNINVILQVEKILQLPESAIIPIENKQYVFVVNEGKAQRKSITIGRRHPGVVEVLSGLVQDEQVVVEGALKLRDGATVKVLQPTNQEDKAAGEDKAKKGVVLGSKV